MKTRVVRLRVPEGPNARDQIAFCAFHSFLVEVQTNVRRMRNNNLEIRIAGSSCRPQKLPFMGEMKWVMPVSTVPNEESNMELVEDNPN